MRLLGALRLVDDDDNIVEQVEIDTELSEGMEAIARGGERFEFAVAIVPESAYRYTGEVINLDDLYPDGVPADPIFTEEPPEGTK
jgi:hypothetical protein